MNGRVIRIPATLMAHSFKQTIVVRDEQSSDFAT